MSRLQTRKRKKPRMTRDCTAPFPPFLCSASSGFLLSALCWLATRAGSPPPLRLRFESSPSPSSPQPSPSLASLSSLCFVSCLQLWPPPPCCWSATCKGNRRDWRKHPRGMSIHKGPLGRCISVGDIPRPAPHHKLASLLAHLAHPATAACPAWRGVAFPASPPPPRC